MPASPSTPIAKFSIASSGRLFPKTASAPCCFPPKRGVSRRATCSPTWANSSSREMWPTRLASCKITPHAPTLKITTRARKLPLAYPKWPGSTPSSTLACSALQHLGLRLNVEQDAEMQAVVSAAFVRLSQEAATSRSYAAMEQALDLLSGVEAQRPGTARSLRAKMGIEERVPEFVDEALRARQAAAGLTSVLKMLPQATMEQLATRFNRCSLRDDAEHVANLAADVGEEGVQYLRSTVRGGAVAEAVEMVGLLCRLGSQAGQG